MGRKPNACRVPFGGRFNISLGQQQFNVSNKTISSYATHKSNYILASCHLIGTNDIYFTYNNTDKYKIYYESEMRLGEMGGGSEIYFLYLIFSTAGGDQERDFLFGSSELSILTVHRQRSKPQGRRQRGGGTVPPP